MLGGDRPLEKEHRAIVYAMAAGIKAGDGGGHLITFHPPGGRDSTEFTGDAPYIDFHTSQTGHGAGECYFSYKPVPDLTEQNGALSAHIASGAGKGYAMAYSPLGLPFTVHGGKMKSPNLKASWFDPRTGEETVFGIYPSGHDIQFVPPTQGKGRDWVLILDELA